ncbi:DUF4372 domain-containing protein [Ascidiimonas meishanensis]
MDSQHGQYVFSQLTKFLKPRVFNPIVRNHLGTKYVRSFT